MSKLPPSTFTGVLIYKKNHVYVSSISDELAEQNIDHAAISRWLDDNWSLKSVDFAISGMCALNGPPHTLLNLGVDGTVIEFTFPGERTEEVDASSEGPSDLVNLRSIRKIGSHIYVAGMARHVYRRDGRARWVPIDEDVFVPRARRRTAVGFNSIDGFSEKLIYAVGYKGEIWHFNGQKWQEEESPTNVVLNVVRCSPDGEVYICGMAGTIIRGIAGQWESIEQDVTEQDFWGMAVFKRSVYISNYEGVYKIEDKELSRVEMNLKKPVTTAYLDANDGVLWSVGENHLIFTDDGSHWTIVDNP
jgi:hypothetical protein